MNHRFLRLRFRDIAAVRMVLTVGLILLASKMAHAQLPPPDTGSGDDVDTIESEIGKKPEVSEKTNQSTQASPDALKEPEKLSDLSKLAPFSDVSVIQRRFLPRTQRFQMYLGLAAIANDPWFWGMGGGGRFGYNFTESWAVEFDFNFLSNSEKDAVKDLRTNNSVNTNSIISAQSYLGVDAVWSPIYGKMSLFNRRIVPFDMYFAFGLGQTGITNATTSSAPSFHVGGGQIFAMSKSIGFRWDLSWNFFTATPNTVAGATQAAGATQFNNLILTLGASFFFPEAKYR